jgi:glycosyltransferase involved in cell wall biosynthesis
MKFERGLKNILYLKKNLTELEKFCIENKINIIHTHHRYPELLANLLKKKLDIRTVTTVHSLVEGFKRLSFKSDKIIAVSKAVEKNLINNFNLEQSKVVQIYNPINIEEYQYRFENSDRLRLGIPKNAKVFLFTGRWSKVKGVDILVKVFLEIFKVHKNVFLILITDVSPKTEKRIKGKNKNFIFIKPQKDLSYFYNISDAIVLPSRTDSFPYVMLEAGIYKKLFIGSEVDGIAEFVKNGSEGLLFESPKKETLFDVVQKYLCISQEEETKIKESFYRKVIIDTDKSRYINNLVDIYNNL